jgi:hypothetical protein
MWHTTGWAVRTWLKVTLLLGVLLAVAAIAWGIGTRPFVLAVIVAVLVELLTIRGLCREWAFDARGRWWWFW